MTTVDPYILQQASCRASLLVAAGQQDVLAENLSHGEVEMADDAANPFGAGLRPRCPRKSGGGTVTQFPLRSEETPQ
jgi:hypothetical protein